jgi:ring-1,2-phenylacetyl-CoA epoxidase subunit PaaA
MMFGPHDQASPNTPTLVRWGIKTKTNDELRQVFVNQTVPEIHALGLRLPDPELRFDSSVGDWIHGPIDWDEFWRVVKGDGPCNAERLGARRAAHEQGQWVREALLAYSRRNGGAMAA